MSKPSLTGRMNLTSLTFAGLAGAAVYAVTLRSKPLAGGILAAVVAVRVGGMLWKQLRRPNRQPRTLVSSAPAGLIE